MTSDQSIEDGNDESNEDDYDHPLSEKGRMNADMQSEKFEAELQEGMPPPDLSQTIPSRRAMESHERKRTNCPSYGSVKTEVNEVSPRHGEEYACVNDAYLNRIYESKSGPHPTDLYPGTRPRKSIQILSGPQLQAMKIFHTLRCLRGQRCHWSHAQNSFKEQKEYGILGLHRITVVRTML